MGSAASPESWVPYDSVMDCSRGFCSIYCPQWCYIVFPPPPPFAYLASDSSDARLSPLLIAIIGILASAFLVVSYYTVVSKYCGMVDSLRRRFRGDDDGALDRSPSPSGHEAWEISTTGLDEAVIKSIAVCRYRKGDGLIDGSDCSVCLNEFREGETLRLLPKCSHAFHVNCIDTWFKTHTNCPLCRASVLCASPLILALQPPPEPGSESAPTSLRHAEDDPVLHFENTDRSGHDSASKSPTRALSNLGSRDGLSGLRIEVAQPIGRSVSADFAHAQLSALHGRLIDDLDRNPSNSTTAGSSIKHGGDAHNSCSGNAWSDPNHPDHIKRSSSGTFLFSWNGRGKKPCLPL